MPLSSADADASVVGWTRFDPSQSPLLAHPVEDVVGTQGDCAHVEEILAAPIPRDFRRSFHLDGAAHELWTAVACGKELPFWVAWMEKPNGANIIHERPFRSRSAPPN
jgi:hypothetical protein